ncbi:type II secretion system GspH family protein [Luteolibacter flavescens]|uniref:Type II secretion system GspH family protein n=1 Tax=Luteolibacter flavescens TaxID=1859460 RepID=A0ABT3FVG7_9BACT|nr:type II secretion system protein [Luteolibacter flavescens]MCW1887593.1 type II secretion system GspH family protein [Luteolibacter flavescens]
MKTRPHRRLSRGFTLVELLVVISIIIVLAAMSFGVIGTVTKRQKTVETQATITALSQAMDAFYSDYNRMPSVGSSGDEMTTEGQAGADLITILLGKEESSSEMQNPKQISYLNTKVGKTKAKGGLIYSNGNKVQGLYDAWGEPLRIKFDDDFDDEISDPVTQGKIVRQKRFVVWSWGPDKKFGDNDEVKSW